MRTTTPHRTPIVLASLVLALSLTTGTALARLVFSNAPAPAPSPTSGPEVTLVRAFYAAVNEALQTGNAEDLDDIVAIDLVEHPARAGTSPGRAGLIETLAALRATFPSIRFVVEDVRSDGGQVAARIRIEGATGRFLGLALDGTHVPWGPIDLFRVANGTIVEHWGVPPDAALFTPLTQGPIHLLADGRRRINLERRDYAPNAYWPEEMAAGPVLILGQTGRMSVTIDEPASTAALLVHNARPGSSPASEPIGDDVVATLVPGDLLVLAQGSHYTTRNDAGDLATILILTLAVPTIPGGEPIPDTLLPEDITSQPQATGPALPIPLDATVQIGRMTLSPGAELPTHTAAGPELLIVESGTLDLSADDELAWVRHGEKPGPTGEHRGTLQTGDGALAPPGAVATYRNAGAIPTAVLVLTILPAE